MSTKKIWGQEEMKRPLEEKVRHMYEAAPYPDLGSDLKDDMSRYWPHIASVVSRDEVTYLDAGCGTGHILVASAKRFPHWGAYGIDLSRPSLDIAGKLSQKHGAPVTLHQGSYMDANPFGVQFDIISAIGTVHHAENPSDALRNLASWLKPEGVMLLHLYGRRCDSQKFDIKEALSLLQPDLGAHSERFELYHNLVSHKKRRRPLWKRILLTSAFDAYLNLKIWLRNQNRRAKKISWSPPWTSEYKEISSPWVDHFCHPSEDAYEVPDVKLLVEGSGLKPVKMLRQGTEHPRLVPPEWREKYDQLDFWEKARMNELLSSGGAAFNMILTRINP